MSDARNAADNRAAKWPILAPVPEKIIRGCDHPMLRHWKTGLSTGEWALVTQCEICGCAATRTEKNA